ncbi:hypothetical protein [Streptomyces sp. NBC_01320]|uniref:hypothetical protein n=1 Tax=Streptomyces sp. NBC_01320 TaxID=2903824 RepID=UPI002E12BABC|nr:hypothetical protein OG395_00955 [Streptomyces sp. NBC_01320]
MRRQRVAVPPGTPVIIYATSPVMALTGTARLTGVDTATPAQVWRRHRAACGISRAEYTAYDRVGGPVCPARPPHHRTCGPASGGSSS